MSEKQRKIALIGSDKSEIVLYFAKLLKQLGKKILIVDSSETKALFYATHANEFTKEGLVDYQGIDFNFGIKKMNLKDYDFILHDFGYQFQNPSLADYEEVWLVTDGQIHNVKRFSGLFLKANQKRVLLFKNMAHGKINARYLLLELQSLEVTESNCYTFFFNIEDLKTAINCQYDHVSYFDRISGEYFDFFCEQLPEFKRKELKRAFKRAGRG